VFLVLLVVMASDTLAYFIGMKFGKHHLYKAVSPNKTIEGALGGLAGAILGAALGKYLFFSALQISDVLALGLFAGISSQVGDLFESLLKRSF
ncbi:MAG: phosphatidate cytidylyltransferase, partial [Gammaproteobacteria bacterium]|nr:phosphatidate cytidylyltransferase [Gammaproteobacteria bacterium]NIR95400.1 phosphatidate cytidylyltransferase [Gammaproteobacteria bacterium]